LGNPRKGDKRGKRQSKLARGEEARSNIKQRNQHMSNVREAIEGQQIMPPLSLPHQNTPSSFINHHPPPVLLQGRWLPNRYLPPLHRPHQNTPYFFNHHRHPPFTSVLLQGRWQRRSVPSRYLPPLQRHQNTPSSFNNHRPPPVLLQEGRWQRRSVLNRYLPSLHRSTSVITNYNNYYTRTPPQN